MSQQKVAYAASTEADVKTPELTVAWRRGGKARYEFASPDSEKKTGLTRAEDPRVRIADIDDDAAARIANAGVQRRCADGRCARVFVAVEKGGCAPKYCPDCRGRVRREKKSRFLRRT
ncbi:hypothetical protein J2T57_001256 [Natronocella acetinitrilica]|uniref:Uncharacterized protein n=1 Tax=Natronocella acetinitrilica TaxID=414046 RepID=A0AAE3G224_9GAMM|nr:hypothetical protein [Natronocella acetinitrilica]MCP1674154.1 hypothetical protein [Natronocella acetinitrilica]